MADKGIIFSAPMVRALLAGTKTQTRRLIHTTAKEMAPGQILIFEGPRFGGTAYRFAPTYEAGDRLYVREHWKTSADFNDVAPRDLPRDCSILTLADNTVATKAFRPPWGKHRQGMHMPRWASRLTLTVSEVRVQRLQEISEEDAIAEGLIPYHMEAPPGLSITCWHWLPNVDDEETYTPAAAAYRALWNSLHTTPGERWEDNPFVVAVSFDVRKGNIDEVTRG